MDEKPVIGYATGCYHERLKPFLLVAATSLVLTAVVVGVCGPQRLLSILH